MSVETKRPPLDVIRWRSRNRVSAGFPPALASRLARDRRWDVHALIELVERGCPPGLAVRILSPLDEEDVA